MAVGVLHSLIGRQSTLSVKNKLILFNMIVKPIMLYATSIWGNTCNGNIKTLQIVQNNCLRMIVNAGPKDRNVDIRKICNSKTIQAVIYDNTRNFYTTQISHLSELKDLAIHTCETAPFKLKTKMPYHLLMWDK